MNRTPYWASESLWKKMAIWVTAGSFVILIILTLDILSKAQVGGNRVPAYSVINQEGEEVNLRYTPILLENLQGSE